MPVWWLAMRSKKRAMYVPEGHSLIAQDLVRGVELFCSPDGLELIGFAGLLDVPELEKRFASHYEANRARTGWLEYIASLSPECLLGSSSRHSLRNGDVLKMVQGWDSQLIEYYQVTDAVADDHVTIARLRAETAKGEGGAIMHVSPCYGEFTFPPVAVSVSSVDQVCIPGKGEAYKKIPLRVFCGVKVFSPDIIAA